MSELREKILATRDIPSERLVIEAWGAEVEVRGMSGRARAAFVQQALSGEQVDLARAYPLIVIECTFDPTTGERLFSQEDFDAVGDKSGEALEAIAEVAMRLSGLDAAAVERSKSEAPQL